MKFLGILKEDKVILRRFLSLIIVFGAAFSLGQSLLFFYNGEFDGSQTLALYAILAWLMIPEKQGPI